MAVVDTRLYKEIGTRIYNMRTKVGFSRQYVADKLQISAKFLYDIENGKKGFTVQILNNLAILFDSTCDYLVRGIEPEPETDVEKALKLFKGEDLDKLAVILETIYKMKEKEANE